jgi:hypothetical protein
MEKQERKEAVVKRHTHLKKIAQITLAELKEHVPFTVMGGLTGILLLCALLGFEVFDTVHEVSEPVFYLLHPLHIGLSAIVITSFFMRYGNKKWWQAALIGGLGSIVVATLSDSGLPYLGELLLRLPNTESHIGFIEEPLLTIPMAVIGVAVGFFVNATKFPHLAHVLVSTWASLFHIIMAMGGALSVLQLVIIFILLFISVWVPCCFSDIVFPMIFMKRTKDPEECGVCGHHRHHM